MTLLNVRPLRTSPAFRRLWAGTAALTFGAQFTTVAVLVQVWAVTSSSVAVGAIGVVQAVAMGVGSLLGGWLADVRDRRQVIVITTAAQLTTAGTLSVLAATDTRSLPAILGVIAVHAAGNGLGAPARRALIPSVLRSHDVGAGIALNHLVFQVALLVGPAAAGFLAAQHGLAACYAVPAVLCAVALGTALGLPAARPVHSGQLRIGPGWRSTVRRPVLRGALLTDAVATVSAMPIAIFPAINAARFDDSPQTFGFFFTAIAVGGVLAGLVSGQVTAARRLGTVLLTAATAWGLAIVGFGLAGSLWLTLGCLVLAGAADTIAAIARGTIVQLDTPDATRGRASAAEHVVGTCCPHLGTARGGVVAGFTSASVAAVSGGVLCVVGVLVIAATSRPLRRFTADDAVHP